MDCKGNLTTKNQKDCYMKNEHQKFIEDLKKIFVKVENDLSKSLYNTFKLQ
jgi:hypothetical protein